MLSSVLKMVFSPHLRTVAVEYILAHNASDESYSNATLLYGASIWSLQRWVRQKQAFGHVEPKKRGPGRKGFNVVLPDHMEYLLEELAEDPTYYFLEMSGLLFLEFDTTYSKRQIRHALKRKGITRKVLERHARQQDPIIRANFRNMVKDFLAVEILVIDETHVSRKDANRKTGYAVRGQRAFKRSNFVNGSQAGCSAVASFSIEGVQTVNTKQEVVDSDVFMEILEDILAVCNPFRPDGFTVNPRSVIFIDGAGVQNKAAIVNRCQQDGVLVFFLPPYSYDFSPIELVFHMAKSYLRREWGDDATTHILQNRMKEALWSCCTPLQAMNLFGKCHIPVSVEEAAWAMRS